MRFSSRVHPALDPSPWSAHVQAARARGEVAFDLTVTNPTAVGLGPDALAADALRAALVDPRALSYEPHPQGMRAAREAVAQHYLRAHGRAIDAAAVWLGASTSELYAQLFMLHCDPMDEVLIPAPSYPLFEQLAALACARAAPYPLRYSDERWSVDLHALRRAITDRTRAIVCVSPNNPTGSRLSERELSAITSLCAERSIALIVDEVFAEYVHRDEPDRVRTTVDEARCLCWTLGGLSKSAALPQMKIGWAVLSGPDAIAREAAGRFEHVADAFLSASAPAQCALAAMLEHAPRTRDRIARRAQQNLRAARALCTIDSGASALDCEAGWALVLRLPAVQSEDEWARALLDQDGVLVQPGYFYDFDREPFVVASLLCEPAAFSAAIARIAQRARESITER